MVSEYGSEDEYVEDVAIPDFVARDPEAQWMTPEGRYDTRQELVNLPYELEDDFSRGFTRVLIGCGEGKLLEEIAEDPNVEVRGIDVASSAVKKSRQRVSNYGNAGAVLMDGKDLASEPEKVDWIDMINVLQDDEDPERLFESASTHLKPGGYISLTAPSEESLDIFPEGARMIDERNGLPKVRVPATIEGKGVTYEQYGIPEEFVREQTETNELEMVEGYPQELPVTVKGFPHMMEMIEEEHRPNLPDFVVKLMKKIPDRGIEFLETRVLKEKGPKVNHYLMRK